MGRWEANASGRLRAAAMQLYVERGFEETTVAEIAARAGLTARTFFRHFADKREVLFAGSAELQARLVEALESAPASATPMQAVAAALDAGADVLGDNREHSRRRQAVINSHAELRERELIKLASLADAMADGLRRRGVPEPDASLAAEAGVVVFRVAFERWTAEPAPGGSVATSGSAAAPGSGSAAASGSGSGSAVASASAAVGEPAAPGGSVATAGESLSQIMRESLDRLTTVTADRGQGSRSTPTA